MHINKQLAFYNKTTSKECMNLNELKYILQIQLDSIRPYNSIIHNEICNTSKCKNWLSQGNRDMSNFHCFPFGYNILAISQSIPLLIKYKVIKNTHQKS